MAETFQDFVLSKYAVAPYRICADLPVHVLEDEKGHLNGKGQSLPCAGTVHSQFPPRHLENRRTFLLCIFSASHICRTRNLEGLGRPWKVQVCTWACAEG